MDIGFLYLQTSRSHPGLVRILTTTGDAPSPATPKGGEIDPAIRYIARFNDVDAARLHAFSALRHHLIDLDSSLFKVDLIDAIAATDSISLPHRLIFMDPDIGPEAKAQIENDVAHRRRRRYVIDQIWRLVGWIAIAWLVTLALASL